MHITRRPTKKIFVGSVPIGGGAPIAVQSMTIPHPSDVKGTVEQIRRLSRRDVSSFEWLFRMRQQSRLFQKSNPK